MQTTTMTCVNDNNIACALGHNIKISQLIYELDTKLWEVIESTHEEVLTPDNWIPCQVDDCNGLLITWHQLGELVKDYPRLLFCVMNAYRIAKSTKPSYCDSHKGNFYPVFPDDQMCWCDSSWKGFERLVRNTKLTAENLHDVCFSAGDFHSDREKDLGISRESATAKRLLKLYYPETLELAFCHGISLNIGGNDLLKSRLIKLAAPGKLNTSMLQIAHGGNIPERSGKNRLHLLLYFSAVEHLFSEYSIAYDWSGWQLDSTWSGRPELVPMPDHFSVRSFSEPLRTGEEWLSILNSINHELDLLGFAPVPIEFDAEDKSSIRSIRDELATIFYDGNHHPLLHLPKQNKPFGKLPIVAKPEREWQDSWFTLSTCHPILPGIQVDPRSLKTGSSNHTATYEKKGDKWLLEVKVHHSLTDSVGIRYITFCLDGSADKRVSVMFFAGSISRSDQIPRYLPMYIGWLRTRHACNKMEPAILKKLIRHLLSRTNSQSCGLAETILSGRSHDLNEIASVLKVLAKARYQTDSLNCILPDITWNSLPPAIGTIGSFINATEYPYSIIVCDPLCKRRSERTTVVIELFLDKFTHLKLRYPLKLWTAYWSNILELVVDRCVTPRYPRDVRFSLLYHNDNFDMVWWRSDWMEAIPAFPRKLSKARSELIEYHFLKSTVPHAEKHRKFLLGAASFLNSITLDFNVSGFPECGIDSLEKYVIHQTTQYLGYPPCVKLSLRKNKVRTVLSGLFSEDQRKNIHSCVPLFQLIMSGLSERVLTWFSRESDCVDGWMSLDRDKSTVTLFSGTQDLFDAYAVWVDEEMVSYFDLTGYNRDSPEVRLGISDTGGCKYLYVTDWPEYMEFSTVIGSVRRSFSQLHHEKIDTSGMIEPEHSDQYLECCREKLLGYSVLMGMNYPTLDIFGPVEQVTKAVEYLSKQELFNSSIDIEAPYQQSWEELVFDDSGIASDALEEPGCWFIASSDSVRVICFGEELHAKGVARVSAFILKNCQPLVEYALDVEQSCMETLLQWLPPIALQAKILIFPDFATGKITFKYSTYNSQWLVMYVKAWLRRVSKSAQLVQPIKAWKFSYGVNAHQHSIVVHDLDKLNQLVEGKGVYYPTMEWERPMISSLYRIPRPYQNLGFLSTWCSHVLAKFSYFGEERGWITTDRVSQQVREFYPELSEFLDELTTETPTNIEKRDSISLLVSLRDKTFCDFVQWKDPSTRQACGLIKGVLLCKESFSKWFSNGVFDTVFVFGDGSEVLDASLSYCVKYTGEDANAEYLRGKLLEHLDTNVLRVGLPPLLITCGKLYTEALQLTSAAFQVNFTRDSHGENLIEGHPLVVTRALSFLEHRLLAQSGATSFGLQGYSVTELATNTIEYKRESEKVTAAFPSARSIKICTVSFPQLDECHAAYSKVFKFTETTAFLRLGTIDSLGGLQHSNPFDISQHFPITSHESPWIISASLRDSYFRLLTTQNVWIVKVRKYHSTGNTTHELSSYRFIPVYMIQFSVPRQ